MKDSMNNREARKRRVGRIHEEEDEQYQDDSVTCGKRNNVGTGHSVGARLLQLRLGGIDHFVASD